MWISNLNHMSEMSRYPQAADKHMALAAQHGQPGQQAQGFQPSLNKEGAC